MYRELVLITLNNKVRTHRTLAAQYAFSVEPTTYDNCDHYDNYYVQGSI